MIKPGLNNEAVPKGWLPSRTIPLKAEGKYPADLQRKMSPVGIPRDFLNKKREKSTGSPSGIIFLQR
jgi:hypothetical protein